MTMAGRRIHNGKRRYALPAVGCEAIGSALGLLLLTSNAYADSAAVPNQPTPSPSAAPGDQPTEPSFTTGLFSSSRTTLLGDAGGLRTWLGKYGITFSLYEESEVFGNATGGIRRGAAYDGVTTPTVQFDTSKAFGWAGGLFNVSAFQIHGDDLSTENLLALQSVSGLEAMRSTRLWELWYQQSFNNGSFDIKVGQQSLDQEFITSANSLLFLNTMMGWPLVPSEDLYAGGPAYPLSSLGVRIHGQIVPNVTGLLGVFDDNPPGGPFDDDPQTLGPEAGGVKFNLNTGALLIGELQYALNQPTAGQVVKTDNKGLPGTYKIGFWYDTAPFSDQQYDTNGISLASPASNGIPAQDFGNFSIYGIFDQVVYQPDPLAARAVSIFARVMGAPGDRNLVSFSANGGATLKAPFEGRDGDVVGLGFGYGQISYGARGYDEATAYYAPPGVLSPIRSSETFIETFYQIQLAPWWQLQPDFQYIFNPGGGIVNPLEPTQLVHDEAVFGVRTTVSF
jgi:porin